MKNSAVITLVALSVIALGSGAAYAANTAPQHQNNTPAQVETLSPEKQAAYDAMMKEHIDRVTPIQDKLNAKKLELNALSHNPNVKPEALSKLAGETSELQAQLRAERRALDDRMQKEFGIRAHGRHGDMKAHGARGGHNGTRAGHSQAGVRNCN